MSKEVIIASKCATVVYDTLLNDPSFTTEIYNIGANDISDIILNKIIEILELNKL